MPRESGDVAASVRARLLNLARERGEEMQRLLVRYALERLLYRLGRSRHADRFALKGAMLFPVWDLPRPRATRDLDLLGVGDTSEAAIVTAFEEIWKTEVEDDGLVLEDGSLRADQIRERATYRGSRVRCRVRLGSAVIPVQVDVGVGDAVHPSPQRIEYPTLLDFPAPRILAYPKEAVVAEKVQIIAELGTVNSRLKDFFDICHLARTQPFDGATLQESIRRTFERRRTPIPEVPLEALGPGIIGDPAKQAQWRAFLRRAVLESEGFGSVVRCVRDFVEPVLAAVRARETFAREWPPGGPWRQS